MRALARHGDVRQRHLRLALGVEPAQLERGPQIGAEKRHAAGEADLAPLGLARQRVQQRGVVLVDIGRGLAELGVFGGVLVHRVVRVLRRTHDA